MRNKNNNSPRDYSWALYAVLILMVAASLVGVVAYISQVKDANRQNTINEYMNSIVVFSTLGEGEYTPASPSFNVLMVVPESDSTFALGQLTDMKYKPEILDADIMDTSGMAKILVVTSSLSSLFRYATENGYEYSYRYNSDKQYEYIALAYDQAYAIAMSKANNIAANTGKEWRVKEVEEVESRFDDQTGKAYSRVKMSFAVDGNRNSEN